MEHVEEHKEMQQMQMQQQMMEAAMTGQAPQDAGSSGDPTQTKSFGKGAPSDAREMAASSDVPPGEMPQ